MIINTHEPISGSQKQQNMAYLGLRFYEDELHGELMKRDMAFWPECLQEQVTKATLEQGVCGDVISCAVADWIAGRKTGVGICSTPSP